MSLVDNWQVGEKAAASDSSWSLEDTLRPLGDGLLIHAVLGLNTQDATRGAYSLGIPRALVLERGKVKGYVRGTLAGNFFEDLRRPWQTLSDPLEAMPIMAVQGTFNQAGTAS